MDGQVHAGCVAIDGRGVLIAGASGRGKSDLALRLVDRGARLVSDDYCLLRAAGGRLYATPPPAIAGRIEVRGIGLVAVEALAEAPVCLLVDLDRAPERLPEPGSVSFLGLDVPAVGLAALEASAAIKVELALASFGLPLP
ncbi:MAG TPA: aldolase [Allosphingosinicella sp.]|jgi:serine kinase of HPr protein (carbohydrate metabolism regulator)